MGRAKSIVMQHALGIEGLSCLEPMQLTQLRHNASFSSAIEAAEGLRRSERTRFETLDRMIDDLIAELQAEEGEA